MHQPPITPPINHLNNAYMIGGYLVAHNANERIILYVDACEILQIDPRLKTNPSIIQERAMIAFNSIKFTGIDPVTFKISKPKKQDKKIVNALVFLLNLCENEKEYEKTISEIRELNKKKRVKVYKGTVSKESHYKEPQFVNSAPYIKWLNKITIAGFLVGFFIVILSILIPLLIHNL